MASFRWKKRLWVPASAVFVLLGMSCSKNSDRNDDVSAPTAPDPGGSEDGSESGAGGGLGSYLCTYPNGTRTFQLRIIARERLAWVEAGSETEFNLAYEPGTEDIAYTYAGHLDDILREIKVPRHMVDDVPSTSKGSIKEGSEVYECIREGGVTGG